MSEPLSLPLPPLRRVVTSHDADGKSIIQSDVELPSEVGALVYTMYGLLMNL